MKVNDDIRKLFKEHKAHFKDLGDIQVLDWKKDNTICQSIRYVFDGSKLYISGDYGFATFWLTWHGTVENMKGLSIEYFFEKCKAFEEEKYSFSSKQAKEEIKYHMEWMFEDYYNIQKQNEEEIEGYQQEISELDIDDEDYDNDLESLKDNIEYCNEQIQKAYDNEYINNKKEILNGLCELADSVSSVEDWNWEVNRSNLVNDLEDYDPDYWEWIYGTGKVISPRIELYLAGLELANEYLESENKKVI